MMVLRHNELKNWIFHYHYGRMEGHKVEFNLYHDELWPRKKSPRETEIDRGCVKLTCRKINDGFKERCYVGVVHLTTPIELVRW